MNLAPHNLIPFICHASCVPCLLKTQLLQQLSCVQTPGVCLVQLSFPLFLFHSCPAFSVHLFGDASLWHTHKLRPESEPHLVPSRFLPSHPNSPRTTSSGIVIPHFQL